MVQAATATQLLVVDDEPELRSLLVEYFVRHGFAVEAVADAAAARASLSLRSPALAILDINMPGENGLSLARWMREAHARVGLVMLTTASDTVDRVVGLELGADDYLPKPFEPRELLARLRAILRRRNAPGSADVLRFGRLEIDKGAREARIDGKRKAMTGHQFALLLTLAERAGRVLSREVLMDLTKGASLEDFDRSIDVHISRLRAAIEDDPKRPRRILTLRGAGYVFAKEQDR